MIIRWVLTVIAIFIMAYITGVFVKRRDMPAEAEKAKPLEIREDYCIGCGLCVKLLPDYYEMKENKAVVRKMPEGPEVKQAILASAEKCPSKAIIINSQGEIL
jgi:ferredoxin